MSEKIENRMLIDSEWEGVERLEMREPDHRRLRDQRRNYDEAELEEEE